MHHSRIFGGAMASVVLLSAFLPALASALPHPQGAPAESEWRPSPVYKPAAAAAVGAVAEAGAVAATSPDGVPVAQPRKFNEKPNNPKKVPLENNEIDDIQTNQITDGFWWSNVLSTFIQMFFNGGSPVGPSKSEGLDDDNMAPTSPWAQVLQVGLKILSHFLGGGHAGGDGIDKVDNSSPMQFINIVVNLLDALKTSFSHRSLSARNMGKKDSVSEAAVAGISLLKGYVRTYKTSDELCMQKYLCEANQECLTKEGPSAIYCQLGSYAASVLLQRSTSTPFDLYYEAGRRGRKGDNCQQIYLACNEV